MNDGHSSDGPRATGGCLCGAVRFTINAVLRDVVNCHCGQCQRSHGTYGAYSSTTTGALEISESRGLKWYASSAAARRGFCAECGSSLFWDPVERDTIAVAAGCLDQPTGLTTVGNIFTEYQGDYYSLDKSLDSWPASMAAPTAKES